MLSFKFNQTAHCANIFITFTREMPLLWSERKPIFRFFVLYVFLDLPLILTDSLSDDLDILRQRKKIYAQGNNIRRKFYMCSFDVKLELFRSYCSSLYTAHLWINYTKSVINKLYTAYHNMLKLIVGVPKWEHTRPICVSLKVVYCPALIRKLIYINL